MRWTQLSTEDCSLARALSVVGDRWTLLILRECFLRVRRFEAFQAKLGIARRVLTERLAGLVADGVLERVLYQERPERYEYKLTAKGLALHPVIMSLVHWGDVFHSDARGPPVVHTHTVCGQDFHPVLTCSQCGEALTAKAVSVRERRAVEGADAIGDSARGPSRSGTNAV
jgi:DNA-binding HxlR family transcriptional regulator